MVVGGIGQAGPQLLAEGSFRLPETGGHYTLALDNTLATGLTAISTPPAASTVAAAHIAYEQRRIVVFADGPTGCGEECDVPGGSADTNDDCGVDLTDLATVLANFGSSGAGIAGDTDGDSAVTFSDLENVLARFGVRCP